MGACVRNQVPGDLQPWLTRRFHYENDVLKRKQDEGDIYTQKQAAVAWHTEKEALNLNKPDLPAVSVLYQLFHATH